MTRCCNGLTLVAFLTIALLALFAARPAASQSSAPTASTPEECAPPAPFTVTAAQQGTNLVLSWPYQSVNWYYHIYHGTTPGFVPGAANKLATVHSPLTSWTNTWALLVNGDLYFKIHGQSCSGATVEANLITVDKDDPYLPGVTFGDEHDGEATYYWEADGTGNCMFPPTSDVMVAAVADFDYGGDARLCGAVARVQGPYGDIQVRIVDRCPDAGCRPGHLDLHPEAFKKIAPMEYGRVDITWELVSPPIDGNIAYHFKDGSNPYWVAVQVRNHRNPLASLEVERGGSWLSLPRQQWNYFLASSGLGNGPFTFRVTDIFGNRIVTQNVPLLDNGTHPGGAQFPALSQSSPPPPPSPPPPSPPPPSFTATDFIFLPGVFER